MADIFNRKQLSIEKPITADMVLLHWGGSGGAAGTGSTGVIVAQATNFSMSYQQQVTRRWTLGGSNKNTCVIYPGRPIGSIRIQRLFVDKNENMFNNPGWDPCGETATITVQLDGSGAVNNCSVSGGTYTARGCVVTGYGITAEADGLTIIDDVTIEFLQLDYNEGSATAVVP